MGSLKLDQGEILGKIIGMILDNFETVFGSTSKAKMVMEADETEPKLIIT